MPPPQDPDKYSPVILALAAAAMTGVLEACPELGYSGFGVFDPRHKSLTERATELAAERQQLQEPSALAAFTAARAWLARQPRRKTLNRLGTSYGLKHVAEQEIGYLSNGVLIAAAIAEGFTVAPIRDPSGLFTASAYLNISNRAWIRS